MADFGMKVSKSGFDVKTSTGKNLVLNSAYNSPKIVQEGSTTITNGAPSTTSVTITHNLGYVPSYDLFFKPSGSTKWHAHRGRYNFDGNTFSDLVDWWAEVSSTTLTIYSTGTNVRTHNIYYMILADIGQ